MKTKIVFLTIVFFYLYANAEDILLSHRGGVYYTPVTLNDTIELEFVIDSGASLVYIPDHVFEQLKADNSIENSDILGKGQSRIANGDIVDIIIINIKKLTIGQTEITNIKAGVGINGSLVLLGQSALKRLEPWSLDTKKSILKITSKSISKKRYVSSSQKIGRTEALDFIQHYLSIQNSRSLDALMSLYAPKVDFLGRGVVSSKFIATQKERYFREWPKIQFDMIKLIETKEPSSHPDQQMVKYSTTYDLYNDFEHRGRSGQMQHTLILKKENGSIKIVSEKVESLSQNSY
ncbi:MAG: retropepsin-like aspartic protease [Campylobacterota bacterium]|nr:retropepsin-like aspartic protease [Campylobacterota bacterium]